jgi:phage-related protein
MGWIYAIYGITTMEAHERMTIVFFKECDGSVPVNDWLDGEVVQRDVRIAAKCRVRIALLREHGNALRRPFADYLRDGIYELRIAFGRVNYRILYFFHQDNEVVVLAHGLTKEAEVPCRDIELALQRKSTFESNPERHTYYESE